MIPKLRDTEANKYQTGLCQLCCIMYVWRTCEFWAFLYCSLHNV